MRATIDSTKRTYAARSSNALDPRSINPWRNATLSDPLRASMLPFSCDSPGLQRVARMP